MAQCTIGPTVFRGKFCQIPRDSSQNSTAYRGFPFVRKLSFILFKKLDFLDAGMALSYASNIQRKLSIFFSFQKSNLSISRIVLMYDCAIYDSNY